MELTGIAQGENLAVLHDGNGNDGVVSVLVHLNGYGVVAGLRGRHRSNSHAVLVDDDHVILGRGVGRIVVLVLGRDIHHLGAADDVGTVTDTDAGCGAVKGVVVGGQAGDGDLVAHSQVFDDLVLGDVAVDEHTGVVAGAVTDHDGLDQALGLFEADHHALDLDQAAQVLGLSRLLGGDRLGLQGLVLAQLADLLDGGHSDLALALVRGGGAGDADLVADLVVAGHGEGVDTGGAVLDVDTVEEGGILVIAGGVGGDHALDDVLDALQLLGLHVGDIGDGQGVEVGYQVLADVVVGVVLLGAGVTDGGLDLEVGHEGRAGDDDKALVVAQVLGSQHHQAVIALGHGVLGHGVAAQGVVVAVLGVGGGVAVDHGGDGVGNGGSGIALSVHHVDGGTAVLAEELGVQVVVGVLGVKLHAVHQEVVPIVGGEVEPLGLAAVELVVVGGVVADTQGGAQGLKNLVLLGGHVVGGGEFRIALIVVGPAGQDQGAAGGVEGLQGLDFCIGVADIGVAQGAAVTAGRSGEEDGHIFAVLILTGGDQVFAGVQLNRAHRVTGGQVAEVAHGVLVVAVDVLVVVGGVDADVNQLAGIQNIQGDVLGVGVLNAVLHQDHGDGNGHHAGHVGDIAPVHGQGAGGGELIALGVGAQDLVAEGVGDGLDGGGVGLAVEQGGGEGEGLVGDGSSGAALHRGDAQLHHFAHPHGGGDSQVAVALGDADEVVAVAGGDGALQLAGGQLSGIVPGVGHGAGVDHHFHLGDGVGGVGVVHADVDAHILGDVGDDGTQHLAVEGVVDLQVLVLGGVDAVVPDGLIQAVLREVVGQDNVTGIVGVAPLALVVVLVVGGGHMPALVQGHDVLLIAGVVAAGADGALAVAHLDQVHPGVNDGVIVAEVAEVAEGGAGVVELADGIDQVLVAQQGVVGLHAGIGGLVVQGGVVAGDDAGGVEGVDVAGAAGPGHFEAGQGHDLTGVLLVEGGHSAGVGVPLLGAGFGHLADVIEGGLGVGGAGGVKVVGVVGEGHEIHVGALGQVSHVVQALLEGAGAVGVLGGVGVELAEVELVLGRTDGEGPGAGDGLFIGPGDGGSDGNLAVRHSLGGLISGLAVLHGGGDILVVHLQGDGGVLACVAEGEADFGLLLVAGLSVGGGEDRGDVGLVLDIKGGGAGKGHVLVVCSADGDHQLAGGHGGAGNGEGVGAVVVGQLGSGVAVLGGDFLDAENGVHGEADCVVLAHIGVGQEAEGDGGHVDHAIGDGDALSHGVEVEGVDVLVAVVVQAVGLVGAGVVLQVLGVLAVELGGAALQVEAAVEGGQLPVGVLGGLGGVEGVVAGAVGAEVAVRGLEAEPLAVDFHGEDPGAVGGSGHAVSHGGLGVVDGGAGLVAVAAGQNALGALVVEHHLSAVLRQVAAGLLGNLGDLVEGEGEHTLAAGVDVVVGAPGTVVVLVLHVGVADDVLHVEQAVACVHQLPLVVFLAQRHAGIAVGHTQLLAAVGEGPGAVAVVNDGPHVTGGEAGQDTVLQRNSGAVVVEAVVGAGQSLVVGGGVDDNLIAVGDGTGRGTAVQVNLAGIGVAQLEGTVIRAHRCGDGDDAANSHRPGAVIILVHHGLVELDGVAAAVLHGDVGIGVGTVVVIHLGDLHVTQGHIGADVGGGQLTNGLDRRGQGQPGGLLIGGTVQLGQAVESGALTGADDGVAQGDIVKVVAHADADTAGAVLKVDVLAVQQGDHTLDRQVLGAVRGSQSLRDGDSLGLLGIGRRHFAAALTLQLVEGEITGIASVDGGVLIGAELASRVLVAGQGHGVLASTQETECAVFKGDGPGVVAGLDAVLIAALGCDLDSIAVCEGNAVLCHGNVPHQIGGGGCDGAVGGGQLSSGQPGSIQGTHSIAGIHDHDIAAIG
ncbi:Uncharacterised protein [uncultured Flavonifractor sp.]|nr:Uncharacterised protein [uncultured Flavonifractor sp.]